ncbi:MAG: DNA polymerase III subunit gamma/tau [Oscillospiraceae bacterium]|nr:DNA polymerase III subunit gamma/tau [Oscillospiraceae bacterium]
MQEGYQALYRKYRPQTFDDVVGQYSVTQTLKNQLMNGRLSHAYLFTGTRGTGKTTCAKILSKAVNCLEPIDGNPCNRCSACRSIDSGACVDVLEIDAASNNGVDNVRSLRDDAVYLPAEVKKRVYIIDEVHMLSMSAFNAPLKIIEEPPEHLVFILATTELHKVPATILSRCQRFSFRRILPEDIVERLNYIAYREHIELDAEASVFLARLADGGLRDAVSLLDQCASAAASAVTTDEVCRILGLAGTRQTAQLLRAVAAHDTATTLELFQQQYAEGKDLAAMLDELCVVSRDLLILRSIPKTGPSLISGVCTQQELKELLPLFSPGELLRMTEILRNTVNGFNTSANRRIDAELCLIRLCEPEAEMDASALNARITRLENKIASGMLTLAQTPATEEPLPKEAVEMQPVSPAETEAPADVPVDETPIGFWSRLVNRSDSSYVLLQLPCSWPGKGHLLWESFGRAYYIWNPGLPLRKSSLENKRFFRRFRNVPPAFWENPSGFWSERPARLTVGTVRALIA